MSQLILTILAVVLVSLAVLAGVGYTNLDGFVAYGTAKQVEADLHGLDSGFQAWRVANGSEPPGPWPPADGSRPWADFAVFQGGFADPTDPPQGLSWSYGTGAEGAWYCLRGTVDRQVWLALSAAREAQRGRLVLADACGATAGAEAPAAFPAAAAATYWITRN